MMAIKGMYLNGWTELETKKEMEFKDKDEIRTFISKNGGAFVFEEEGEKRVIRSDDERGERSILLGKLFNLI